MSSARSGHRPYTLPNELLIDTGVARKIITAFIRGQLEQTGFANLILALSGGIDSALVAYLAVEAIGPDKLMCLMLPYRSSSPESRTDAEEVVRQLGCQSRVIDISPIVDGYLDTSIAAEEVSALRRGNLAARARMVVVFDQSVPWRGLVIGTGNKTEALLGYTTNYGDNACAFNPIGDLYKSQVRQLAEEMGVPDPILDKAPSADLWQGQTDEQEIGLRYEDLDRLLYWMVDRRYTDAQLIAKGFDLAAIRRVQRMIALNEFKRQVPPVAKLTTRTPGVDYLYPRRRPLPRQVTDPAEGAGGAPLGTLFVVATPIGNMADITLRALEVLRSVPLVAAEDTRMARRIWARHGIDTRLISYHAQSGPAREAELLDRLGRGEDLALITDAGTPLVSDPGAELVAAWTRRGGRVVPIPGASAVLAALVASGLPAARWTFEGFLPRRGRERRELIERIANDERTSVLFEAPGRAAATLADLAAVCGSDRRAALCRELTKLHEDIWRGSLGSSPRVPRKRRRAVR